MRNLLLTIFSICSFFNLSYSQDSELIDKVLSNLKLRKVDCEQRFISEEILSDNKNESIVVIPEIHERNEEEGILIMDSFILIVDNQTGEILSQYFEKRAWYSDAVILSNITLESDIYQVNETKKAFAINLFFYAQGRAVPFDANELSLFVREGNEIRRILKNFPLTQGTGEWDTNCSGYFENHEKILKFSQKKTNNYFDIIMEDTITKVERGEKDGDCIDLKVEHLIEESTLKYSGKEYEKVL